MAEQQNTIRKTFEMCIRDSIKMDKPGLGRLSDTAAPVRRHYRRSSRR